MFCLAYQSSSLHNSKNSNNWLKQQQKHLNEEQDNAQYNQEVNGLLSKSMHSYQSIIYLITI